MARSNEPIWWSLFSAGGVVAAFFMPITIVITGIAVGGGWITANELLKLAVHPLARLYLFVLISFPLFHWAHRFRFVAVDLGLKGAGQILAVTCYGMAILGTALAALFLVSV
jgi:fumarate reductase subunit D